LRLAFLLAALAAAGPMPSVGVVDAARQGVSIAWFLSERVVSPRPQHSKPAIHVRAAGHAGFHAHPTPVVSSALLPHSLFQRPPPLQS
jgi:hypothetical protein